MNANVIFTAYQNKTPSANNSVKRSKVNGWGATAIAIAQLSDEEIIIAAVPSRFDTKEEALESVKQMAAMLSS